MFDFFAVNVRNFITDKNYLTKLKKESNNHVFYVFMELFKLSLRCDEGIKVPVSDKPGISLPQAVRF